MEGLKDYEHIHVLGSDDPDNHTGIVAFTIDNVHPHDVSEILSSMNNKDFRISMCTVTYDDNHNPLCVLGLIEAIEEDPKLNCVVNALIRNFNSVYYVDIDTEQVYPYKINPAVRSMLNNSLDSIPLYSDLMKEYIDNGIVADFQDHHYPSEMAVDAMIQTYLLDNDEDALDTFLKKFDTEWVRYNRDIIEKVKRYQEGE